MEMSHRFFTTRPGLTTVGALAVAVVHGDGLTSLQYREVAGGPRLHLHGNDDPPVKSDNVDLAERTFPAPCQDAVAVRDQPGGGTAFGRKPEAEGNLPLRRRLGRARQVTARHRLNPILLKD